MQVQYSIEELSECDELPVVFNVQDKTKIAKIMALQMANKAIARGQIPDFTRQSAVEYASSIDDILREREMIGWLVSDLRSSPEKVVEIYSGLGLPSLAYEKLNSGSNVVCVDHDEETVNAGNELSHSLNQNARFVHADVLNYLDNADLGQGDILIVANKKPPYSNAEFSRISHALHSGVDVLFLRLSDNYREIEPSDTDKRLRRVLDSLDEKQVTTIRLGENSKYNAVFVHH